jgi:hypothetical protein
MVMALIILHPMLLEGGRRLPDGFSQVVGYRHATFVTYGTVMKIFEGLPSTAIS